jgi:hypothetical protein
MPTCDWTLAGGMWVAIELDYLREKIIGLASNKIV